MTQIPQHFPFPIPRKAFKAQFGGGFAVRGEEFGEHGAFKLLCFGKAGALLGEGFVQPSEKIAEGGLFGFGGQIDASGFPVFNIEDHFFNIYAV